MKDVVQVSAGIDWSGGGTKIKSRTVLTVVGRLVNGTVRLLYYRIFPGTNPVSDLAEITNVLRAYDQGQMMIVGDAGEGNANMDTLRHRFNQPSRIVKVRYVGEQNAYIAWNKKAMTWTVHRTPAVDSLMGLLKSGGVEFPKEPAQAMEVPFADILNEYVEVTKTGRKRWAHAETRPDDFLHALVFGRIGLQLTTGELNLATNIEEVT